MLQYYDPAKLIQISNSRQSRDLPASYIDLDDACPYPTVMIRDLIHAVKQLPARQHQIIALTMRGFLDFEIAQKLKISLSTVRVHRSKAIQRLRSKFESLTP